MASIDYMIIHVGDEWEECRAFQAVTPRMAAEAALPFHPGGYGRKNYPTSWKVNYKGRDRRIYSTCYSNVATLHIVVAGQVVRVRT